MLNKLTSHPGVTYLTEHAKLAGQRLADQHINLAVTGLSQSGKTAFITSLVNQLLLANSTATLPFFAVAQQHRLLGVRKDGQPDVTIPRFTYEAGMQRLDGEPPQWPASTTGVSQVRLQLRYRHHGGLRKLLSDTSTLTLDITDYPGEWLLDLPLLEMDYRQWCEMFWQSLQQPEIADSAEAFIAQLSGLTSTDALSDEQCHQIATTYCEHLRVLKQCGHPLVQPGRLVLPGDLAGAPVLDFFPLTSTLYDHNCVSPQGESALLQQLSQRFEEYKQQVVKPFYQKYFRRFDRQIILVDCLNALNAGQQAMSALQQAINWLLGSFHYGTSNVLKRLFSPRIDKLIFAASKADHITPDQQDNLVKLLESMVHEARQQIQYEGVATESTAIAAVKASEVGSAQLNGEPISCLRGMNKAGEQVTLYPGDVPDKNPGLGVWQQHQFTFPNFQPPQRQSGDALPHIRMDRILEFVLGDKLQ